MKKFVTLWLTLMLLLPPPANASSAACSFLFGNPAEKVLNNDAFNNIIRNQARGLGLEFHIQSTSTYFSRWRARRLFAQATEANFKDENFRVRWIERIIDLKVDEGLDIRQLKRPITEGQRSTLTRLVLRTLLQKGLQDDTRSNQHKIKSVIHRLRNHPAFRLVFLWQLPQKTVTLTDDQVASVTLKGTSALENDPMLLQAFEAERAEELKRRINSTAILVFGALLLIYSAWETYPVLEAGYETGRNRAVDENTKNFLSRAEGLGQMNSDALALQMAEAEIKILTADFTKKFAEKPTLAEAQEIRNHVCRLRYGDILSSNLQLKCLGSP